MIEIKDKKDCCGCWACENVCPRQCISMEEDEEGFRYPQVDKDVCIDCHLCEKVCPIINAYADTPKEQRAYLLQHKSPTVLKESASGGAFTAIASYVIQQGGIAFGAAYDKDFQVVHRYVDNEDDLSLFRNSKYVQSKMGDCYKQAKDFLQEGRLVCFSGTPCQLEGLLHYLRKSYENLVTVDVMCHSITSPKIFRHYVELMKERLGGEIDNIVFRDKRPYGYKYSQMSIYSHGKQAYKEGVETDVLLRSFFSNVNVRPSCYACRFKRRYRMTDFTLWDCFNVYEYNKVMDNDKGVSRILAHTEKGRTLMHELTQAATIVEIPANEAVKGVKEMLHSVPINPRRQHFFKECENSAGGGKNLYKYFPATKRALLEKSLRITLCRLGIYSIIKRLAKTFVKDIKRT